MHLICIFILQFSKTKSGEGANSVKQKYKKYYENSKERKKRLWKEKQEKWKSAESNEAKERFSDWMFLPDLILEHIFKFLSYKVKTFEGTLNLM